MCDACVCIHTYHSYRRNMLLHLDHILLHIEMHWTIYCCTWRCIRAEEGALC